MKLEHKNILIVSNEPWSDIWYSKHNYAWELSKKNNVFFINSPKKWKISNLYKKTIKIDNTSPNLTIISFENILPSNNVILKEINNIIASIRIRAVLKKRNISDWIFWTFTPLILFRPKLLNCCLSIFHVVDQHWTKFYGTHILSKQVNCMIMVSEHLTQEYKFTNKKKIVIEHGISEDEFLLKDDRLREVEKELNKYGKFGLYVGVIDKRLDYNLINKLVNEFNHINFVFVGPLNIDPDHEYFHIFNGSNKNIVLLGPRPYKDLKYYIQCSDFCISPMDVNYPGNNISHHKTFPYLAQGKPIFSPSFKAYNSMDNIMYVNNDYNHFIKALDTFLRHGENQGEVAKRINFSKLFLYGNHLNKIETLINDTYRTNYCE